MSPVRQSIRTVVRPVLLGVFMTLLIGPVVNAATSLPPDAWRDDADLHATHFSDRASGWAVGDRGVAWRTADGGKTWEPRHVPSEATLQSVYFLNQDVGWVAGGSTTPYTGLETGVIFITEDAGVTWRQIHTEPLPRIHAIRFFDARRGVAVGAASPACVSGVLTTTDGGRSWKAIESGTVVNVAGWRAAAFTAPDRGVVVGPRERRAGVGAGQLIASRESIPGLRGLNAVSLIDPRNGWAAGDGGLVLKTTDAGLIWEDPPATLPQHARSLFDLQAVAAVGERVWVAGRPGSIVWHSPDSGNTWQPQQTGSTLPIHALHFVSENHGVAVGAMGQILRTSDGGVTWTTQRGADRRAALLAISLRADHLSFPLTATLAGDQGYRMVALLPVRHDLGAAESESPNFDLRVRDAVTASGGNAAIVDWPLPLLTPGLDRDQDALVASWNRRTEGRLEEILVGRLVAAVRTWKPAIIVLDSSETGNAAANLLIRAAELAIGQAADPTRYVEHRPALSPWQVQKVYRRTLTTATADAVIDANGLLSRLGMTTGDLAETSAARIGSTAALDSRETYELVPGGAEAAPAGPFFSGLAITPGSPARRAVGEPREDPQAALAASRQRMVRKYSQQSIDDPRKAAALLAQMEDLSAGLSPRQSARQLHYLAEMHRRASRWDLAEQTYLALIERHPETPAGRDAMTWLMRLWTGSEPVWRRMRGVGTTTTRTVGSAETLAARVDTAFRMAEAGVPASTETEIASAGLGPDPLQVITREGALKIDATRRWDDATVSHWRAQALRLGSLIRRTDPALFSSPQVQFPLAVAVRMGGGSAVAYMQRFAGEGGAGWSLAAAAELTLTRSGDAAATPTAVCGRAVQPPHLDGVFSDPCWQAAKAQDLLTEASATLPAGGLLLLARDDQFLYLAASIPRAPGRPMPTIELAGRTHDADLVENDRLLVTLDLDRDYATYYRFGIDHRGQTAEDCWGDPAWNPQWFVAVEGDDARWRVEAAIPFEELGPTPPRPGDIWAIAVSRIVPAVGVQGWPRANDGQPRPESFGLLRFE